MFDIRKLKPAHGWREFSGEVGIIVLGVLIALAAGQAVDTFHQRAQLDETLGFLNASLAEAKLNALSRIVLQSCLNAQLEKLREDVDTGRAAQGEAFRGAPITEWDTGSWSTAVASGALLHMALDRKNEYSNDFSQVQILAAWNRDEFADWSEFHILDHPIRLTDINRDRLLANIAKAEQMNMIISLGSHQLYESTKTIGVHFDRNEAAGISQINAFARRHQCRLPHPLDTIPAGKL